MERLSRLDYISEISTLDPNDTNTQKFNKLLLKDLKKVQKATDETCNIKVGALKTCQITKKKELKKP